MGEEEYSIELEHYYKTLLRKPGALANSLALRQATQLKKIFREYYTENPREFLEKLIDGKDELDVDELAQSLIPENSFKPEENELENRSIRQLEEVQSLFTGEQEDEPSD